VLPREEVDKKDELKLREEETVIQSFSNVRVQIENQSASTSANAIGTLTLTSERVVFQRREGRGDGANGGEGDNAAEKKKMPSIQIGFKSVCMHAISSCSSSDEKCLYVQVDGKCDPEVGVEEEEGEEDEDDEDYEPMTELRFVPVATSEEERKAVVEEMFERMNECALLNPDTEDENDENDDPMMFDGMITAETLLGANGGDDGDGEYFTSEAAIRAAGLGEKLDEFDKKLVISEEDRKRFEDAEEEEEEEEE